MSKSSRANFAAIASIAMLAALDGAPDTVAVNPDAKGLAELCDHIEFVHHGYLEEELPPLDFMTRKVAAVQGDHEPRLLEVRRVFETFNKAMTTHTREEDETVFPAIRQLEAASGDKGAVASELKATFAELESERSTTGWRNWKKTCTNTFHKENNILFPRALAMGGFV